MITHLFILYEFRWTVERWSSNLAIIQVVLILHRHYTVPSCLVCLFASPWQQIQQDPNCQVYCPNHFSYLLHDHTNFCRLFAFVSNLSRFNAPLLDRMASVSLARWRNFGTIHWKTGKEKFCEGITILLSSINSNNNNKQEK